MDNITFIKVNMNRCLKSYPCKHYVETDNGSYLMTGNRIAYLQKKIYNNVDEHFRKYKPLTVCDY